MISKIILCFSALTFLAVFSIAQTPNASAQNDIKAVLYKQQAAWNKGDTETFLQGYASDTIFVGNKITRGLDEVRVRYQTTYPTIGSMGRLEFSDLEVHMLSPESAFVIGHWRIDRKPEDGGEAGGTYTLVFKRTAKGWKIVLDHTV